MYIHTFTRIYMHAYIHACMHTYIHTYIHFFPIEMAIGLFSCHFPANPTGRGAVCTCLHTSELDWIG